MSVYATKAFWAGTLERTIEVGATSAIAVIGTGTLGIIEVDWMVVASATALAVILNLLRCLAQPEFISGKPAETAVINQTIVASPDHDSNLRAAPEGPHGNTHYSI